MDDEQQPLIRFRNKKTGLVIYPMMVKDSKGNWVPSDPAGLESLMRDDLCKDKPDSGNK